MQTIIMILVDFLRVVVLSRATLQLENIALRQQVAVLKRERPRPWLRPLDRVFWVFLSRLCLNHVIFLNERHLRRILVSYLDYYHRSRTHLSLGKDSPDGRSVKPGGTGKIVPFAQVGGLHHRYERLAA